MPAKAKDLEKAATPVGSIRMDGRRPFPIHGNSEIGGWLFYEILKQLGISEDDFWKLMQGDDGRR